jgi:ATP-dependent Clp protease adaptor protein ClpS
VVNDNKSDTSVKERTDNAERTRRQSRYQVILWDDNDHTYQYVVRMLRELFGHADERGYTLAKEVDENGRAICLTTTREHAELKKDQIHAFGPDRYITRCAGSMWCTIEPVE